MIYNTILYNTIEELYSTCSQNPPCIDSTVMYTTLLHNLTYCNVMLYGDVHCTVLESVEKCFAVLQCLQGCTEL